MTTASLQSVGYIECGENWPELVELVHRTLAPNSVLDLGCGPCRSLAKFKELGVPRVVGIDGAVALLENQYARPHRENIILVNLEQSPVVFGERFDLVWSYEVAEHVANEKNYLDTLTENAGQYIVMTAAPPGQGGTGHVNCQTSEHWIRAVEARGFTFAPDLLEQFKVLGWERGGYIAVSGLVFRRGAGVVQPETVQSEPAPEPKDIKIGAHFLCYKQKRATLEALRSFRQHFPDAPVDLVNDNGADMSDIAEHFDCNYIHCTESAGNGVTTAFDTHHQAMLWFRRFESTCERFTDVDWIVILEDDVRTCGPIRYFPPAPMAGPCTMPFSSAAQFAIKLRHPGVTIRPYSGCGGTIIHRETFLKCMQNLYDIGQVTLLDDRLARHSDAMLTYLFLWNGYENALWLDHSERSRGVGRPDAAFDHQYKRWYGVGMEQIDDAIKPTA